MIYVNLTSFINQTIRYLKKRFYYLAVDISSIEFTGNNSIKLHMSKTISTVHTIDKKASLNELMSLIEQMKNYDAIKNEDTKNDFTP